MPLLRHLISRWNARQRVAIAVTAATAVALGVALPVTLSWGGNGRTAAAHGLAPGTTPIRSSPLSSLSSSTTSVPEVSSTTTSTTAVTVARTSVPASTRTTKPPATTSTTSKAASAGVAFVWSRETLPVGTQAVQGVSCVSPGVCYAVGYSGVAATTDSGRSWKAETSPALRNGDYLVGVSCVNAQTCWVVSWYGSVLHTSDGGRTWSEQAVPSPGGGYGLSAISCVGLSDCWALGNGTGWAARTVDGGHSWTRETLCGMCVLDTISCTSSLKCWAAGALNRGVATRPDYSPVIFDTSNGGSLWSVQLSMPADGQTAAGTVSGISCIGAGQCVAVGRYTGIAGLILATSDGGARWTQVSPPPGARIPVAVSCTAANSCWAAGSGSASDSAVIIATRGSLSIWGIDFQGSSMSLSTLDCVSQEGCWAGGDDPVAGTNPPPGVMLSGKLV
jgi:photosystem II stability/assembly factor-like uncharacterized protein